MAEDKTPNTDEAADPSEDVKAQNPGGTTTADLVNDDDPQKVQKLAQAGRDADVAEASE